MRVLIALFLVAHGAVHAVMWSLPFSDEARVELPMDPTHSWLAGDARTGALVLAGITTLAFLGAGIAYVASFAWWPTIAIVAAIFSFALLGLFFSGYWAVGFAIDAAIVVAALRALQG